MGIVIETFGKCNASCLSKAIMFQAGSSPDDKVSINVEHECITVKKSLLPKLTDLWSCLVIIRVNGKVMR